MPLRFRVADAGRPRFKGEFVITAQGRGPLDSAEQDFADLIAAWMDHLAKPPFRAEASAASIAGIVQATAQDLRQIAQFCADGVMTLAAAMADCDDQRGRIRGRLDLRREQKRRHPFVVRLADAKHADITNDSAAHADDIEIVVRDLPIPTSQKALKVEIDRSTTVIKAVFPTGTDMAAARSGWAGLADFLFAYPVSPPWRGVAGTRAEYNVAMRSRYMRQLWGIAAVGLEMTDETVIDMAKESLAAFQEEFRALEAGDVKNGYLQRLGGFALLVAGVALAAYCVIRWGLPHGAAAEPESVARTLYGLRNLPLLLAGTSLGTWLSFSLRRPTLTFLDLAALEEDRLDPKMRVLFVCGLSLAVGLLLWCGAISVGLGDFKPRVFDHGVATVLLGLLLGIAERTIANSVYKRATDFAGSFGGKG